MIPSNREATLNLTLRFGHAVDPSMLEPSSGLGICPSPISMGCDLVDVCCVDCDDQHGDNPPMYASLLWYCRVGSEDIDDQASEPTSRRVFLLRGCSQTMLTRGNVVAARIPLSVKSFAFLPSIRSGGQILSTSHTPCLVTNVKSR